MKLRAQAQEGQDILVCLDQHQICSTFLIICHWMVKWKWLMRIEDESGWAEYILAQVVGVCSNKYGNQKNMGHFFVAIYSRDYWRHTWQVTTSFSIRTYLFKREILVTLVHTNSSFRCNSLCKNRFCTASSSHKIQWKQGMTMQPNNK